MTTSKAPARQREARRLSQQAPCRTYAGGVCSLPWGTHLPAQQCTSPASCCTNNRTAGGAEGGRQRVRQAHAWTEACMGAFTQGRHFCVELGGEQAPSKHAAACLRILPPHILPTPAHAAECATRGAWLPLNYEHQQAQLKAVPPTTRDCHSVYTPEPSEQMTWYFSPAQRGRASGILRCRKRDEAANPAARHAVQLSNGGVMFGQAAAAACRAHHAALQHPASTRTRRRVDVLRLCNVGLLRCGLLLTPLLQGSCGTAGWLVG